MTDPAEYYSAVAAEYDREYSIGRLPDHFKELRQVFSSRLGTGRILDAGCGTGRDTEFFTWIGYDAIGIDVAPGMIEYARENHDGEYEVMDLRDMGFEDDAFEGVWCPATMYQLPESEMRVGVGELARVLGTDGTAVVGFKLGDGRRSNDGGIEEYLIEDVTARELLTSAGLKVEDTIYNPGSEGYRWGNYICAPR